MTMKSGKSRHRTEASNPTSSTEVDNSFIELSKINY